MRLEASLAAAVLAALALSGCEREQRRLQEKPSAARPASATPSEDGGRRERNAYDLSQGKRLFEWYNCAGCHAQGGGGSGVPLMDDEWRYGHEPRQVYASIVEGRPNGMPSFAGRLPEYQVWQLVAYVRSLGGLTPRDAMAARGDELTAKPPDSRRPEGRPK